MLAKKSKLTIVLLMIIFLCSGCGEQIIPNNLDYWKNMLKQPLNLNRTQTADPVINNTENNAAVGERRFRPMWILISPNNR